MSCFYSMTKSVPYSKECHSICYVWRLAYNRNRKAWAYSPTGKFILLPIYLQEQLILPGEQGEEVSLIQRRGRKKIRT